MSPSEKNKSGNGKPINEKRGGQKKPNKWVAPRRDPNPPKPPKSKGK